MPVTKHATKHAAPRRLARKSKFQADLAPIEDQMIRRLKQELEINSNSVFLSDALALFRWAVSERRQGRRIISESGSGERKELVLPSIERVAPDVVLPHVQITSWNARQIEELGDRLSSEAPKPTEALIRAMRG